MYYDYIFDCEEDSPDFEPGEARTFEEGKRRVAERKDEIRRKALNALALRRMLEQAAQRSSGDSSDT
jgi:hypothetical protein